MAQSAIKIISSIDILNKAWTVVNHNSTSKSRETLGIDGISVNQFSSKRDQMLKMISAQLRSPDGYNFSPLTASLIPKPNGNDRIICVPTVSDRVVQRALNDFLVEGDKCGIENSVSYGFIKNRSVESAAKKAKRLRQKHKWSYKADITKFFDNIPRVDLINILNTVVKQKSLHNILSNAVACEIEEPKVSRRKKIQKAGIEKGVGVRQGMPLSPLFANILLKDFDKAVESRGYNMIRYADDLIVFCNTEAECLEIHEFIKAELDRLGLVISDPGTGGKTFIYKPDEIAEFLGVGIVPNGPGYSLDVLKSQTEKIRNQIHQLSDFNELTKQGLTLGQFDHKLRQQMDGYREAYKYCDNISQFESAIENARASALTKVFTGLGIDVNVLDESQKKFLGIH